MSEMTTQEAMAALAQMSSHGRALAHAEKVLKQLANAEQVGRELDQAIAEKRALHADAVKHLDETRISAQRLDEDARQNRAVAAAEAADIIDRARKDEVRIIAAANMAAADIAKKAEAEHKGILAAIEEKRAQLEALNNAVEVATSEHDAVREALNKAKAHVEALRQF